MFPAVLNLMQQQQFNAMLQAFTCANPLASSVLPSAILPPAYSPGASASMSVLAPPPLPTDFPFVNEKCLADLYDLAREVDLDKLLQANSISSVIPGETKISQKDDHYVLTSSRSKRVEISLVSQWNEAFLVMKQIRSFYYPILLNSLDTYQTEVNSLAGTYAAVVWLEYDKRFR